MEYTYECLVEGNPNDEILNKMESLRVACQIYDDHIEALKENKKYDARIKRNKYNREKNQMLKDLGIKQYRDSLGSYYE